MARLHMARACGVCQVDRASFDLAMRFQLSEYGQRLLANKMLQCVRLENEYAPVLFSLKMATLEIMAAAMERRQAACMQAGMFEARSVDGLLPRPLPSKHSSSVAAPSFPGAKQGGPARVTSRKDNGQDYFMEDVGGHGGASSSEGCVAPEAELREGWGREPGRHGFARAGCSRCGGWEEKLSLLEGKMSQMQQDMAALPHAVAGQVVSAVASLVRAEGPINSSPSPHHPPPQQARPRDGERGAPTRARTSKQDGGLRAVGAQEQESPRAAAASAFLLRSPSASHERASTSRAPDVLEELRDLRQMLELGLLSSHEFGALKHQLLRALCGQEREPNGDTMPLGKTGSDAPKEVMRHSHTKGVEVGDLGERGGGKQQALANAPERAGTTPMDDVGQTGEADEESSRRPLELTISPRARVSQGRRDSLDSLFEG